jgi:hypothetical protein
MTSTRIGCSGWNYDDWRGRLYPPGVPKRRWLEVYAEHFDTVEVNTTFYRLPKRAAVAAWADQTPNGFEFTVKASRYLTHIKRLTDVGEGVRRFYERIEPLGEAGKLGPVLWQLPANFHRDDARLEGWLAARPRTSASCVFTTAPAAGRELLGERACDLGPADRPVASAPGRLRLLQQRLERLCASQRCRADQAVDVRVTGMPKRLWSSSGSTSSL